MFLLNPILLLFFVLSLLNLVPPPHYFLWKLSILTKEYGHFMGLAVLLIFLLALTEMRVRTMIVALITMVFLFFPLVSVMNNAPSWQAEIQKTLGAKETSPQLFSLKTAFLGRWLSSVPFERVITGREPKETHLDFYRAQRSSGKAPVVVVIHGGGWNGGDSEQLPELNWILAQRGYAVAAVSYRFAPEYPWPAQKEDVMKSINYLKQHADELGIDMTQWFLLGRSAGAQVAGSIAYTLEDAGLKGFIGFYTPSDLTFGYEVGEENDILASRGLVRDFLGGTPTEKKENYADSSLIEGMRKHPVPTLLLHGRTDLLTWFKHSERLVMRLQDQKIPYGYILMPWATHGFDFNINGPGGQVSTAAVEYFLAEQTN